MYLFVVSFPIFIRSQRMSFLIEINSQSSNLSRFSDNRYAVRRRLDILVSIHTDNPPIVCRPTHLSVHNAYYWKVGRYQSILGSTRVKASRSVHVLS